MFHTAFQSSVQLMLITALFLFSLNPWCVCVSVLRPPSLSFFFPPLLFFSLLPLPSPAVSHRVSPCYDYITLSLCCVHLDLKLITSDNLLVLFPKFKSFSGERERAARGCGEMERTKHVGGTYHL